MKLTLGTPRHVRITHLDETFAGIQTVFRVGDGSREHPRQWRAVHTNRATRARVERFNGKRSGYALYEDCP